MAKGAALKVFWSWQSDTHQPSGRHFVRDVLHKVCVELTESTEVDAAERPEIDHDTLDVAGSPPIAETILKKISEAAVFVADVTPVSKTSGGKHVANPNVMIELGYALSVLGHQRLVLVMNTAEGASLKHLPFDLKHWRKPISYALKRDVSDEVRATVAEELAAAFKRSLVPSLKLAATVERERQRRTHREPELAVNFQNDEPATLVRLSQKADNPDAKSLQAIKAATPLLPLPSEDIPRLFGSSASTMSGLGMTPPPSQWSREDTEGYNSFVERYYRDWERYLDALTEWSLLCKRIFSVELLLSNTGTAPATNIDVQVLFPPHVAVFEADKLPERPEAPKPPPLMPLGPGKGWATPLDPKIDFGLFSPYTRKVTTVDTKENCVYFETSGLKHSHSIKIGTFAAGFLCREEIQSFTAQYVVTANEPIDSIIGELQFQFELDGMIVGSGDGEPAEDAQ